MTEGRPKTDGLRLALLCVHSHPLGRLGTTDHGGMSVFILETARELGRSGCRVDIFTRDDGRFGDRIVHLGENVRLVQVAAGSKEPLTREALLPYIDEFRHGLESFRKQEGTRYDLVHAHYWLSGLAGLWARTQWTVPLVIMFHTIGAAESHFSPGGGVSESRLARERELIRDSDLIVSPTAREKEEMVHYYQADPDRISVIPCGVDLKTFRPFDREPARKKIGLSGPETVLVYAGRIDAMKGLDRLIGAAALLARERPVKVLIIGGDDSPRAVQQSLQEMSRRLGLEDSVVFTGSRPQAELPMYFSAADVMVLPSRYESFGLVGLEALACGVPVVAADVGVYPRLLDGGPAGRIVPDDRPESIAAKVLEILAGRESDPAGREEIRRTVQNYTWPNTAAALLEEYRRLIGESRTGLREKEKEERYDSGLRPADLPPRG